MSGKPNSDLRAAIRAGYRAGITPREIAEQTGSTAGSVKVLAHKMGVNDTPRMAAVKRWSRKTGNPVEHSLTSDYDQEFHVSEIPADMVREFGIQFPDEGRTE